MFNPYTAGLAALALFTAGVGADRLTPIVGANAQLAREREATTKWRDQAGENGRVAAAWKSSANSCAANRTAEQTTARTSATNAQTACDARVAAARRSAAAIQSIVSREVPRDANDCPVRQLVPAGELRDAFGAAAPTR